jgi:TetR/AcrR family transcriptional regulator, transcriptional repressor of bet genes
MGMERRAYHREPEEKRREALILAVQDLVAEGGPKAATVRAIAARAGVTAGLIRHYFQTKEDLIKAAYRNLMDGMTEENAAALDSSETDPAALLASFVAASLRPPVMGGAQVGLWAGFLHSVRGDPTLLEAHESGYLHYRDRLQGLIAALPRDADTEQLRGEAIACNAIIDGLWLEGSVIPHAFGPTELQMIGIRSVGAILGVDLMKHKDTAVMDVSAS